MENLRSSKRSKKTPKQCRRIYAQWREKESESENAWDG